MKESFQRLFAGKRVLITGDSGFKGSWLSIWLHEMGAQVFGYSLPPKTERDNFVRTGLAEKITHENGDIVDYPHFLSFTKSINPDIAFHLAAQPLVLQSYEQPRETFETNLMGTVNFFEAVRQLKSVKVAINITSDKCYENKEWVWGYRENDPMGGKDPYSASKGGAELITSSFLNSFFHAEGAAHVASARAGNVIGGGDWAENRIVPDFFTACLNDTALTIRNPEHTRPWQHVLEPLSGYLQLAARLLTGGKQYTGGWNFGPLDSNHYTVGDLIQSVIKVYGKGSFNTPPAQHKLHEAHLLKLDISKAMKHLSWRPALDFAETVSFTVKGYQADLRDGSLYADRVQQIKEYSQIAKQRGIQWAS